MAHKLEVKNKAIDLRKIGWAFTDIRHTLNISRATLHGWIRDIELSDEQVNNIKTQKSVKLRVAQERLRQSHIDRKNQRLETFVREAKLEWETLKSVPEFMFGLALYIGEGAKGISGDGEVNITNLDPRVIRKAIDFFRLLGKTEACIKIHISVYDEAHKEASKDYWLRELLLPNSNFNKIYIIKNDKMTGARTHRHPMGVARVRFYDVGIKTKLNTWMELALK